MVDVVIDDFLFIWKIENVLSLCQRYGINEPPLVSPAFIAENLMKNSRCLKLELLNVQGYSVLGISLIGVKEAEHENRNILCEILVIMPNGEILIGNLNPRRWASLSETDCLLGTYSVYNLCTHLENYTDDSLVISCRFAKDEEIKNKPIIVQQANTAICVQKCSFYWNIRFCNYSNWTETRICPNSDVCPVQFTWTYHDDAIIFYIQVIDINIKFPQVFRCRITLLDVNGIEKKRHTVTHVFNSARIVKFDSLIKKSYLIDNKDLILKNGSFTLMCDITVSDGRKSSNTVRCESLITLKTNSTSKVNSIGILQNDLKNMFVSKKYSDARLCVDNDTILAHRSILASRSPVFAAMFERDMTEKHTGIVNILDVDKNILEIFLEFLYTGKKDVLDYETALKLLKVADKYNVSSLVEECTCTLISMLKDENVCTVLNFASMIEHQGLKDASTYYIKTHSKTIIPSSDWIEICKNNPKLASEVLTKLQ